MVNPRDRSRSPLLLYGFFRLGETFGTILGTVDFSIRVNMIDLDLLWFCMLSFRLRETFETILGIMGFLKI